MLVNRLKYYDVKKIDTIKEIIDLAVNEDENKIAFQFRNKNSKNDIISKTYKEFQNDINYLGTAISNINMLNNHIACIGENSYEWITVYLTVLETNGVFVPIDKELTCKEIINVLKSSDSEMLFYSEKFEKNIDEIKSEVPNIKYFICFNDNYNEFKENGKTLFENGNTVFSSINHKETNTLKMLVYTSGTTGNPKGVMLSEHNLVSSVYYGLQVSNVYTKCLSILPYHHTYEAVSGILVGLHKHVTICINDSLKNLLKNLQIYKPDYIYIVPAIAEMFYKKIWSNAEKTNKAKKLKFLIKFSNFLRKIGIDARKKLFKSIHEIFGGNLIKIVAGGAPIRSEIGDFFESIGICLVNGYGITECSPLVSANMDNFNDPKTVGIVLPCSEIKFENINENGDGEICVKGDTIMLGYYKEPEKTDRVLKDGWFNTEDFGRFNDKNQLVITGRKKNIIVLDNGKNIYPEEIENYIYKIPYISECIVKGIKNDIGEEIGLCAEVFLNKDKVQELELMNIEECLKKDISRETKELPIYKHISKLEIRDTEFDKTTTNKIKR